MRGLLVFRVRLISGVLVLASVVLAARLYIVQIVHGDEYAKAAAGQYVEEAPDVEDRHDILFTKRDGTEVAAAVIQTGWRLVLQPKLLEDAEAAYQVLSAITPIERSRYDASAAKKDDPYEEIAFRLSDGEADAVRAYKLPGVLLVRDQWRQYPAGELAANTIGFVGYRGEHREGVYGLERYYEDTLKKNATDLYVNPFAEIFTNVAAAFVATEVNPEGSVVTTIEPGVQAQLERMLREVNDKHSPRQVGGIVMDPKTGDVIALAVTPTFNPNTYNTESNAAVYANPLIEGIFEMGSIIKPLAMAAAIDAGAVTPKTTYDDKGFVMKSGKRISNFDGRGRGVVDMQEVLSQSLNTGMSFVVDRMGEDTLAEYFQNFKLGEETGIDLPNEVAGNLTVLEGNADVDFASASFGQSIALTPIATTRALSALANGGVLPEPHLGRFIRFPSGTERPITQVPETRVLKEETAETVTRMLVNVFDDALLNGELKQEHYSIAAKTGTAQIALPECGGYCADRYLHSFFGYFPAHDARFIVFLYAVEPHGEMYASRTLAHPFLDIAKFIINYYELPPDR